MIRRWLIAAVLAAVAFCAAPGVAAAAVPPTLGSVTAENGRLTATWALAPGTSSEYIEVSRSPAAEPDGDFVESVDFDVLDEGQTQWRSSERLRPGTYFVHVSASDLEEGGDAWSNVVSVDVPVPLPLPGRYTGRTEEPDAAPVSFRLPLGALRINNLKVKLQLTCTRGEFESRIGFSPLPLRDGKFSVRGTQRFRGGGWLTFAVKGELVPPDRARGTLRGRARHPLGGRCRNFFGVTQRWSARRR